jgi:hypothetical protein
MKSFISLRNVAAGLVVAASGWATAVPAYTVDLVPMPAGTTFSVGQHVSNRGDWWASAPMPKEITLSSTISALPM